MKAEDRKKVEMEVSLKKSGRELGLGVWTVEVGGWKWGG